MNACVIYSSVTGNARKVAEAMDTSSDVPLFPITKVPDPEQWDVLGLGFWVRKGLPDARILRYINRLHGKRVFFFGTLGAWPDSEHALRCVRDTQSLLEAGDNQILGHFVCQGKVNPTIIERSRLQGRHPMTEERRTRLAEAQHRPNESDLKRAAEIWQHILNPALPASTA